MPSNQIPEISGGNAVNGQGGDTNANNSLFFNGED
jgi:hypothetical protein